MFCALFLKFKLLAAELMFAKIEELDIGNIWFQQDSFKCHTAKATLDVLCPVFEDYIISCRADVV